MLSAVLFAGLILGAASAAVPLLESIGSLRAEGTSFLVSSHDQAVVAVADRVLQVHDGVVVKEVA